MAAVPRIRPAARILLIDEWDRTFLFKSMDPANPTSEFWCPVGGGIEHGESSAQAAHREVVEETGFQDVQIGPLVWQREHIVSFNGALIHTREDWFFTRVKDFAFSNSGFSEIERLSILEYKWWTLDELKSTTERLTPRRLPWLLEPLLRGNFPETPIKIGA